MYETLNPFIVSLKYAILLKGKISFSCGMYLNKSTSGGQLITDKYNIMIDESTEIYLIINKAAEHEQNYPKCGSERWVLLHYEWKDETYLMEPSCYVRQPVKMTSINGIVPPKKKKIIILHAKQLLYTNRGIRKIMAWFHSSSTVALLASFINVHVSCIVLKRNEFSTARDSRCNQCSNNTVYNFIMKGWTKPLEDKRYINAFMIQKCF